MEVAVTYFKDRTYFLRKRGGFISALFKNTNVQSTDVPTGLKKVSASQKLPGLRNPTGISHVFKPRRIK